MTGVLIGFLLFLCLLWYRNRKQKFHVLKNIGVPGPTPSVFFGNNIELDQKGNMTAFKDWTKKYGKVYGIYNGIKPTIVISDPKIVKSILITHFHKFHSRSVHILDPPQTSKYLDMFLARGNKWKRLRTIAAPSFTARRMKEMFPLINQNVDVLMDILEEKCKGQEPFDIHDAFGRLTLDVIASCAFGIDARCQLDNDAEFLKKSRNFFDALDEPPHVKIMMKVVILFPQLISMARRLSPDFMTLQYALKWHFEMCKKIIVERKRNQVNRPTNK